MHDSDASPLARLHAALGKHPLAVTVAVALGALALQGAAPADAGLGAQVLAAAACATLTALGLVSVRRGRGAVENGLPAENAPAAGKRWALVLALACLAASAAAFATATAVSAGGVSAAPAGAAASAASSAMPAALPAASSALSVAGFAAVCACVGFYEEGLFRVLVQNAFERGFAANGAAPRWRPLLAAVLTSSVFALLHLSLPAAAEPTPTVLLQGILKFSQGLLFGLAMTVLVKRPRGLALAAAAHALYDAVSFAPGFLATGSLPAAYLTGSPADTVPLALAALLLAPALVAAATLAYGGAVQRHR